MPITAYVNDFHIYSTIPVPDSLYRRLEKLVLSSIFRHKSLTIDDVKLAELSNNCFKGTNVTFYGSKHTLTPPIYYRGGEVNTTLTPGSTPLARTTRRATCVVSALRSQNTRRVGCASMMPAQRGDSVRPGCVSADVETRRWSARRCRSCTRSATFPAPRRSFGRCGRRRTETTSDPSVARRASCCHPRGSSLIVLGQ